MTKITEEVYDVLRQHILNLICDKPTDAILRCLDAWMILNDIQITLERLYAAGVAQPKRDAT